MGGNPILSKVDFVGSPLTQNTRTLRRDCHRQCCFAFSFRLQTHQVLSEPKKSDADKREKLLDLYVRTEKFLDQLDTEFIETLQASLGDSYNRSLLKMYVVAYETSSKTENFY